MGRRTKRTPATVREILGNIETGLTDRDAALAAGIASSTFYAWLQEFPEFSEAITCARARRTRHWLSQLNARAEKGDLRAIEALLDRCAPDYRKTSSLEASVIIGAPDPPARDLSMFTDDEVRIMAEIEQAAWERSRAETKPKSLGRPMGKLGG